MTMLQKPFFSRRQMLQNLACGFGSLALADIAHAMNQTPGGQLPLSWLPKPKG